MATTHVTKEPVVLSGYQSIFKPSEKYNNHTLGAILDQTTIDALEEERVDALNWARSKAKNPKRVSEKLEPWEEIEPGKFQVKFSWKPDQSIPIVDSEGSPITDPIPLYSGSLVKLAFRQKPYVLPDAIGTSLKLSAIQVIQASSSAGVDRGDLNEDEAAALFGQSKGFKVGEPNVVTEEDTTNDF